MVSLIVTIIAVLLVIAISIAMFYFGGGAYSDSSVQSRVNKVINEAEQITGTSTMYRAQRLEKVYSLEDLINHQYLRNWGGFPWEVHEGYIEMPTEEAPVCEMLNERMLGEPRIPTCDEADSLGVRTVCCTR